LALTNLEKYQRDTLIKSAAIRGDSANSTLAALKEMGLGMQRSTFLNTYREYAGIPKKENAIQYTPKKYYISPENHTLAEGFISDSFRYTIRYDTINPTTGESFTRYTRLLSPNRLTFGAIMDEAALISSAASYWNGEEVISMKLHTAEYSEDAEF
jgi:hypothetical protein